MKKMYSILVIGCDDTTSIEIQLTYDEYQIIQIVANEITEASHYPCMPTMEIKEIKK